MTAKGQLYIHTELYCVWEAKCILSLLYQVGKGHTVTQEADIG